eukprot:2394273-Rhodomonas_salina.1
MHGAERRTPGHHNHDRPRAPGPDCWARASWSNLKPHAPRAAMLAEAEAEAEAEAASAHDPPKKVRSSSSTLAGEIEACGASVEGAAESEKEEGEGEARQWFECDLGGEWTGPASLTPKAG